MKKIIWKAEDRFVPALRRLVPEGFVQAGTDITKSPKAAEFVDQGLAEVVDVADPSAASTAVLSGEAADETQPTAGVSIPLVITAKMRRDLKARGYSDADVDAMTPQDAHDKLAV